MNELQAKRQLVEALGGTGPINNDRQFWATVLTALKGSFASANTEHEFWGKFAKLLGDKVGPLPATQAVVSNNQDIEGTGGTFKVTVSGGNVTGGTWTPDE